MCAPAYLPTNVKDGKKFWEEVLSFGLWPLGRSRRGGARAIVEATFRATLPAFPNDQSLSREYYENLMSWLVETDQVEKEAINTDVASYWTNEIAL